MRRGQGAWFHDVWTCSAKVLEYWMIFSLKIKLNHSWKLQRNWNVPLVFLERSWWEGFIGIYLVRFGFRMWEILIFKWFLPLKIQINSKKPSVCVCVCVCVVFKPLDVIFKNLEIGWCIHGNKLMLFTFSCMRLLLSWLLPSYLSFLLFLLLLSLHSYKKFMFSNNS
jgi:hypothetical protein